MNLPYLTKIKRQYIIFLMKKFLKMLFGRLTIIGLAIVLQVIVLFYLIFNASVQYYWFNLINTVLGVIVFLHLVNRDMYPDNKIPWLAIILILPLFGTVAYILLSPKKISYAKRKYFKKVSDKNADLLKSGFFQGHVAEVDGEYQGDSNYIKNVNAGYPFADTYTEYFSCGEDFFSSLRCELEKAEKFIFMEYFIVEYGTVWNSILDILKRKVREGVDVRFIYDDIGSMSKVSWAYDKTLRKYGINAVKFAPFHPIVSAVHNNRNHRKVTVIDGKVAYTGGINLADEYANVTSPYGHWKDSAVMLKGKGVIGFTMMFLMTFNGCKKTAEDFTPYLNIEYEKFENQGIVQPFADGPAPLAPQHVGENVYLNIINGAKKYLYVTTPYLIIDHELQNAFCLAAQRGVDVRIITPHIPDKKIVYNITRSNYKKLLSCGVKIYEYTPGFIHAKNLIADDKVGVIGTINLDYRSLVHHFEDAVWMKETKALREMKADFDETFEKCNQITVDNFKMSVITFVTSKILQIFAPLL